MDFLGVQQRLKLDLVTRPPVHRLPESLEEQLTLRTAQTALSQIFVGPATLHPGQVIVFIGRHISTYRSPIKNERLCSFSVFGMVIPAFVTAWSLRSVVRDGLSIFMWADKARGGLL